MNSILDVAQWISVFVTGIGLGMIMPCDPYHPSSGWVLMVGIVVNLSISVWRQWRTWHQ